MTSLIVKTLNVGLEEAGSGAREGYSNTARSGGAVITTLFTGVALNIPRLEIFHTKHDYLDHINVLSNCFMIRKLKTWTNIK